MIEGYESWGEYAGEVYEGRLVSAGDPCPSCKRDDAVLQPRLVYDVLGDELPEVVECNQCCWMGKP